MAAFGEFCCGVVGSEGFVGFEGADDGGAGVGYTGSEGGETINSLVFGSFVRKRFREGMGRSWGLLTLGNPANGLVFKRPSRILRAIFSCCSSVFASAAMYSHNVVMCL